MSDNTAAIHTALEELTGLPTPVHAWRVKEGLDATDDPAVWVWAIIDEADYDAEALHQVKDMARAVVRSTVPGLWPYVLVRGLGEPDPTT